MVTLGEVTYSRVTQKFNDEVEGFVITGSVTYDKERNITEATGQILVKNTEGGENPIDERFADFSIMNGGKWANVNASLENHCVASEMVNTVIGELKVAVAEAE
jgi:hypothetical protein